MQQERLRALGQMASGIAHDINNAISPVSLYTESLLEREPNLSERARSYLVTIQQAIEDVANTVARMREFYRNRAPELVLTTLSLDKLAQQVIDLTRARWSDVPMEHGIVINLQTDFPADLPKTMGAEAEIRDALTNLIFNAVDAMPQGGTLLVRTRALHGGGDSPATAVDPNTTAVAIEVCDTGIGMNAETRQRCLEPFYTTKGERGTGLGLAMVYGMVQRHSAGLEIESLPGRGTTVRLIFPVANSGLPAPGTVAASPRIMLRRRLLIVDDDPLLIKSLRDALEADGHVVVAAGGGQAGIDAFALAATGKEAFDLVITDLGMPYVDGRKVAASIKERSPAIPIVMLTGWGQRMIDDKETPEHVDRVLSKPPRLHELRSAIADLTGNSPILP
jgi:CheY-like chemotaxis protein